LNIFGRQIGNFFVNSTASAKFIQINLKQKICGFGNT